MKSMKKIDSSFDDIKYQKCKIDLDNIYNIELNILQKEDIAFIDFSSSIIKDGVMENNNVSSTMIFIPDENNIFHQMEFKE